MKILHVFDLFLPGSGGAVAELLAEKPGRSCAFKRMGVRDTYSKKMGNQDYLLKIHSLTVDDIAATVLELKRKVIQIPMKLSGIL